jgi:uncharacterized protein (TIGR03435 family)
MILSGITALASSILTRIEAPVANHLWQSTVFAGLVGLLTLLVRKNRAQTRYSLWLITSVKFLIPFSLLVGVGSRMSLSKIPAISQPRFYLVMQDINEPFASAVSGQIGTTSTIPSVADQLLPILLLLGWLCGCTAVLCLWWFRWRSMTKATSSSGSVRTGRELDAFRRVRQAVGKSQIENIAFSADLEPGILGIFRPILVLPVSIVERLTDAQLEAIVRHELCHVRRRDNLAAAIHMLVEAIFWFHPLVWWIGERMVEERELACDEEVLRLGSDPQTYAEGILKVCEFYLKSRTFCAAGITGPNLKKRIEAIMTYKGTRKLDLGRKLLFIATGTAVSAAPIVFGFANMPQSRAESHVQTTTMIAAPFKVASMKPNKGSSSMLGFSLSPERFTAEGITVQSLIEEAYGVGDDFVSGAPGWLNSERYDLDAKPESSVANELHRLTFDERVLEYHRMLQMLLANHCKLSLHWETRTVPAYLLVVANNGPKLTQAIPDDTYPSGMKDLDGNGHGDVMRFGKGLLSGQGVDMAFLVRMLAQQKLGRPVVDKTGLAGKFDFTLQWTPDESRPASFGSPIFAAIEEQLGLRLEPQNNPVKVLVIDNIEKPSED